MNPNTDPEDEAYHRRFEEMQRAEREWLGMTPPTETLDVPPPPPPPPVHPDAVLREQLVNELNKLRFDLQAINQSLVRIATALERCRHTSPSFGVAGSQPPRRWTLREDDHDLDE